MTSMLLPLIICTTPCFRAATNGVSDCSLPPQEQSAQKQPKDESAGAGGEEKWTSLFNGKDLEGWKPTRFGGEGEVRVEDGAIVMEMGGEMTGITWAGGELPEYDYEISLEAKRIDGSDFFCGLTFPVGKSHCSFIVGGWGGGVVGLSSLDGLDASENETVHYMTFKEDRWYKIRVKVTKSHIQTWIDDKQLVDVDITGRKVGIRAEVRLSRPLGVATWLTTGALRDFRMRRF